MSTSGSLSGISFSGLGSGIDVQSIVSQLMQIESIPVTRMQTQQQQLQAQLGVYDQLKAQINAVRSAVFSLSTSSSFQPVKSSTSDSTVATITADSTASVGIYALAVQKLAQAHKVVSTNQSGSDTALGYSGEVMIDGKSVTIEATDTLSNIASKINGLGTNVIASLIGGSGSAYLTLTSKTSGAASTIQAADVSGSVLSSLGLTGSTFAYRDPVSDGFKSYGYSSATSTLFQMTGSQKSGSFDLMGQTISVDFSQDTLSSVASKINSALGGSGVTAQVVTETVAGTSVQKLQVTGLGANTPTDTDGVLASLGVLQANYKTEAVAAQDAAYTLDGISLSSYTNTVTDAVAGVTINLLKDQSQGTATSTLTVTRDTDSISKTFSSFMTAFNQFADFVSSYSQFDSKTYQSGPLFGDTVANQAVASMQGVLFKNVLGSGTYRNLADLGFGLDSSGKLTLDQTKLSAALTSDPESVRKIMVSTGSSANPDITFVSSTSKTQDPGSSGYSVNITQLATQASTTGSQPITLPNQGGEVLSFTGSAFSTQVDLNIPVGTTATDLVDLINNDSRLKNNVKASLDGSGALKIEAIRYGSLSDFQVVSNLDAGPDTSGIGKSGATYVKGVDVAGTINGEEAVGTGQYLTGKDSNSHTAGLQIRYAGTALGDVGIVNFTKGIADQMMGSVDTITDSTSGILTSTETSIQSQIDELSKRITDYQATLDKEQQTLQQKFLAMDQAIAAMKQQQTQLTQMYSSWSTSTSGSG